MKSTYSNISIMFHYGKIVGCGYKYTVEAKYNDRYYHPLTAFRDKQSLKKWLSVFGLKFSHRNKSLVYLSGTYSRCSVWEHSDFQELKKKKPRYLVVLENGNKTMGLYIEKEKTLYVMNPNTDPMRPYTDLIYYRKTQFQKYLSLRTV